ncbi:MAG: alpha/beta fold hydrolase [Gemmatimonadaceae bacterium]|nr:alpha/beta fold hydrolase [Gemmatimonadaceae bacterium]
MPEARLAPEQWWPAREPTLRQRFIALPTGVRMRVVEAGPTDAPPVVLLHGWGILAYLWRHNVAALVADGYRVVAPDLPGHGLSDIPLAEGSYSVETMIAHLVALFDALAIVRAPLVAQSMGGMLAVHFAHRHPERVGRLVLISPVGFGRITPAAALAHAIPDIPGQWIARVAPRAGARLALWRVYGTRSGWSERDVDEYWAPTQRPELPRAMLRLLREFAWDPHAEPFVRAVTTPALVVFGTRDRTVKPTHAERLVRAMPRGQLVIVPGAGHVVNEERPDEFNPLMLEFLRAPIGEGAGRG